MRSSARVHAALVGMLALVLATPLWAEVRRPPAISTEGVPTVPDELAERLNQYQNVRMATFLGWAPDGKGMLIATRFGGTTQLHRVYEPGGRREQVTFFAEPATGRFLGGEPTSGDLLVSLSKGGDENNQLYFVDAQTGKSTLLTDGKSRYGLGPVRKDGSRMVYNGNQRNGRDSDIYVADPRQPGSAQMVMEVTNESWQPMDWSPDGYRVLMIRYVSINETYPAILDLVTRKLTPLPLPPEAKEKKAAYSDLHFAPDGKSVYLATDARGEFRELARVDLATGAYTWISEGIKWNVEEIAVNPKNGLVAFTVNADGQSELCLFGPTLRRVLNPGYAKQGKDDKWLPQVGLAFRFGNITAPGSIGGLRFSPKGPSLAFTHSKPDAPADAFAIAIEPMDVNDEMRAVVSAPNRWTYSETGGLPESAFTKPTLARFKSFDGREIPAFVFRPKGASEKRKAPVVISIHGGPEAQYRPLFTGDTQFLVNELGLAVIAPNVRGSDGYGKTYLTLDNAEKREDSVKDIGALLDWIATQPDLDAKRVAVMGGSYGGYMVLASLVNFPDRIRAGIDIVGIGNFVTFLERTAAYRRDLRRAEYGDERDPKMKAVFEKISPANRADRIKSALMVVHGRNDPRVPFYEAEQIAAKVKSNGGHVWTVYAANEGHGFQKKENRDYLSILTALFLKEHLGDANAWR